MVKGKCLCGKTQVTADFMKEQIIVCHCSMCLKQAAGPIFYSQRLLKKDYDFTDRSEVNTFDSSKEAERGFCQSCGTFLFMRYKKDTSTYFNIELFDEIEKTISKEIHLKDKRDYYSLIT